MREKRGGSGGQERETESVRLCACVFVCVLTSIDRNSLARELVGPARVVTEALDNKLLLVIGSSHST
jgi:hypothetical protein